MLDSLYTLRLIKGLTKGPKLERWARGAEDMMGTETQLRTTIWCWEEPEAK